MPGLLDPVAPDVLGQDSAARLAAERVTPFGEYFGTKAVQGFKSTLAGAAIDAATTPGRQFGDPTGYIAGAVDDIGRKQATADAPIPNNPPLLKKEDYERGPYFRDKIPYDEGFTEDRAKALAESYDRTAYRESLVARYQGGLGGQALGLAANIAGGAVDPTNYIPFLGEAAKAAAVARLGRIAGTAAVGSADALIGTALAEPFIVGSQNQQGADLGASDVAIDLALAGAAGGIFGAAGGLLERRQQIRQSATRLGTEGSLAQLDAVELGAEQLSAGQPLDLSPVLGQSAAFKAAIEKQRQRLLSGTADVTGGAEGLDVTGLPEREPLPDGLPALRDRFEAVVGEAPDGPEVTVKEPSIGTRVYTSAGREVETEFQVVDARELLTSQTDDLERNPDYPAELQPRDRTRASSQAQIAKISGDLRPELLGPAATAGEGAPIVGRDGTVVESGNGRVLAIRRAYQEGGDSAARYRQYLAEQGYDTTGIEQPVLVRRRTTDLSPQDRVAFTREANQSGIARMTPSERATADAGAIGDEALADLQGGDVAAAGNRPFARRFLESLPESERGELVSSGGELSKAGVERIRNAVLAKAYGDANVLARLTEDADSGLGPLGKGLVEASPDFARLRSAADAGSVAGEGEGGRALVEAVRAVADRREKGEPLQFSLDQSDILGGGLSEDGRAFYSALLARDEDGTPRRDSAGNVRLASAEKIGETLRRYAEEARKQQPGKDIFGATPSGPLEILRAIKAVPQDVQRVGPIPERSTVDPNRGRASRPGRIEEAAPDLGPRTLQSTPPNRAGPRQIDPAELLTVPGVKVIRHPDPESYRRAYTKEGREAPSNAFVDVGEKDAVIHLPPTFSGRTRGEQLRTLIHEEGHALAANLLPKADADVRAGMLDLSRARRQGSFGALEKAQADLEARRAGGGNVDPEAAAKLEQRRAYLNDPREIFADAWSVSKTLPRDARSIAPQAFAFFERELGPASGWVRTLFKNSAEEAQASRPPIDFTTVARPEAPHPSIVEAAGRVGRKGERELPTFAKDAGLDGYRQPLPAFADRRAEPGAAVSSPRDATAKEPRPGADRAPAGRRPDTSSLPPELADIEALRRTGDVTPEDERALADAEEEATRAESYADAYQALVGCVLRYAA